MYRQALDDLKKWKTSRHRKPLIIEGARQVGKTWLMKEFGNQAYDQVVYVNFDDNKAMHELFRQDLEPNRLLRGPELYTGQRITPQNTLLIFDEVQEVPRALASLKYFYENAPQYSIMCAGSLLGIALHQGTSFPVGKVDFLRLYPMNFDEFLRANDKAQLADMLKNGDTSLINALGPVCRELLKQYFVIGGMPEAVSEYISSHDFKEVQIIQDNIIRAYEHDFSKHAPNDIVPKINMVWNSIPAQLARENNRFLYGVVREGGRAREFETAILWLLDCGLIHKLYRSTHPVLPLKSTMDLKTFKIYLNDIGLLSRLSGLHPEILLHGNDLFTEYKGTLTEQFVLQELICHQDIQIGYYTNERSTAEIDFLLDTGSHLIPLEVKASTNLKAKSLKTYIEKFHPDITIRASMADYRREETILNLPLYAIGYFDVFL